MNQANQTHSLYLLYNLYKLDVHTQQYTLVEDSVICIKMDILSIYRWNIIDINVKRIGPNMEPYRTPFVICKK